ncbi:hypothetical protein CPB84DRAFT_1787523 [Gymnopilus junonius]|uniref:Uncharacterized protein n=1 Tax=Gymnopilus junonius TaxID=109634 RepID=A0A9P5TJ14_GYMJU|nr:hypothetical protein CPB84DRAFT_1787523 [Gymnopilus junonius]
MDSKIIGAKYRRECCPGTTGPLPPRFHPANPSCDSSTFLSTIFLLTTLLASYFLIDDLAIKTSPSYKVPPRRVNENGRTASKQRDFYVLDICALLLLLRPFRLNHAYTSALRPGYLPPFVQAIFQLALAMIWLLATVDDASW